MNPDHLIKISATFEKLARSKNLQSKLKKLWLSYQKAEQYRNKADERYEKAREKLTKFMHDNELTMNHLHRFKNAE